MIWFISFDLPKLTSFTTGFFSFEETRSLSLTGLIDLIHLIWSSSINHIYYRISVILWNKIIEFNKFAWFDPIHLIFLIWPHSKQDGKHSIWWLHWVCLVWLIWFNSFDLPQLTTFTTGTYSFYNIIELNLTSLID